MPTNSSQDLQRLLGMLYQAHPWHGISAGDRAPDVVTVFVELVPSDTVKYEIDKPTGYLKLDRPQRYSSLSPEPYGFIPRTLCDTRSAALAGRPACRGDQDPLDICVLTERTLNHGGLLVNARPIGGLRMFDGQEVDDKIIGVLESDPTYATWKDIDDCPEVFIDRIRHYFLTYKDMPGEGGGRVEITDVYDASTARAVIAAAQADYLERYGEPEARFEELLRRREPR
jgi:inorganic pyrophosphatase